MAFKEGDTVRQIAPVISGVVQDIQFNKGTSELEYLFEYTDGEGNAQSRWFTESQLEAV